MKNENKAGNPGTQQTSSHRVQRLVRHSGNANHRLKQNPLERQYAELWRQKQDSGLLEYLMGDGATRGAVSKRDELVAATVIQWLGSPVGQSFLRGVNSLPNNAIMRTATPVVLTMIQQKEASAKNATE